VDREALPFAELTPFFFGGDIWCTLEPGYEEMLVAGYSALMLVGSYA
jgi:hypothetical protein